MNMERERNGGQWCGMLGVAQGSCRFFLILVGLFIGTIAMCIEVIASASLSAMGNSNPVSNAIPDWPDAWMLFLVGAFMLGVAALKCALGCCGVGSGVNFDRGKYRCSFCGPESVLCNSVVALIAAIVLMAFVLGGSRLLSDDAWAALRGQAVERAGTLPVGSNTTSSLQTFAADVFSPGVLTPMSVLLVILLVCALLVEIALIYCMRGEQVRRGSLLPEKGMQLAEGDAEAPAAAPSSARQSQAPCTNEATGSAKTALARRPDATEGGSGGAVMASAI